MERVVTINLNGNPYQLEEPAYDALRAYMERAQAALADNPDKAEIIRDLEQAIADKCGGYLSPSKTVISREEMNRILTEMGPVEGASEAEGEAPRGEGAGAYDGPRKRLYRVKERAVISGVCSGIGAYFDLDPNAIRVLFILAALFTSGFGIIVYIILMFAIPSAHTSEEWAAAHGVPFNAQEIIDRAKREYGKFADDSAKNWRTEQRAWRRQWREQQRSWSENFGTWDGPVAAAPPAQPAGYVTRMFAGLFAFIFSVITAALLIAFLVVLFTFLTTGGLYGWEAPPDIPNWLVVVLICIIYGAISTPFAALRRTSYATLSGHRSAGGADDFVTLILVAVAAWFAWMYVPEARLLMEQSYVVVRDFITHWTN
ncbi:MAG TPA: PspC domain-containing protein [Vitreimonas sp.]|uniref:PspC domain-containing protein n=1 Tax=Vitreimonas sp. TaxID=3069702 RepID=UPI002D2A1913|nr:PspC domain-containing protein [Vitreimonas sp.]HYD88525.1 PspC domain-containing protein [Vitreimonas sp.]